MREKKETSREKLEAELEKIIQSDPIKELRLIYKGTETNKEGKKICILECENHRLRFYKKDGSYIEQKTIKLPIKIFINISTELRAKIEINPEYRLNKGDSLTYEIKLLKKIINQTGRYDKTEIIIEKKDFFS